MVENNQLERQKVKRPWQSTVLIFLLVIQFLMNSYALLNLILIENNIDKTLVVVYICGVHLSFCLVYLYLIFGFLKKGKISIIISIILFVFFLIKNFFDLISIQDFSINISITIKFLILIFALYLSVYCLKHPFYNQKKVGQKV